MKKKLNIPKDFWKDFKDRKDFDEFFKSHIVKIISLATDQCGNTPRYLSKNNANIARIPYLQCIATRAR